MVQSKAAASREAPEEPLSGLDFYQAVSYIVAKHVQWPCEKHQQLPGQCVQYVLQKYC